MKYWNKDRKIRQQHWIKVTRAHYKNNTTYDQLKRWCQLQSSTGKFYVYYGTDSWWFERSDDALLFLLTWA